MVYGESVFGVSKNTRSFTLFNKLTFVTIGGCPGLAFRRAVATNGNSPPYSAPRPLLFYAGGGPSLNTRSTCEGVPTVVIRDGKGNSRAPRARGGTISFPPYFQNLGYPRFFQAASTGAAAVAPRIRYLSKPVIRPRSETAATPAASSWLLFEFIRRLFIIAY